MIVGELYQREGQTRLRNMRHEATLPPGYVELVAMPSGSGPWTYDAPSRTAVPSALTSDEKIDRLGLPPRIMAALVVSGLPAADTLPAERAWARGVLLDARDKIRTARQ